MRYLRVYNDRSGESHFEDVELASVEQRSPVSSARARVAARLAAEHIVFREVTVDHPSDEPHVAPRRQFVVHLEGEAELEVSDGQRRRIGAGSVVLVEDTAGKGHVTRRVGDTARVTLMIALPCEPALTGSWSLQSWETQAANGEIGHPFGRDAEGLLIYSADGRVSGLLSRAGRPPFSRPRRHAVEFSAGEEAERAAAFDSFLAYAGRWELGDGGVVRHHVEVASIPGWAGTTLERELQLDGDELTLRTPPRTVDGVEQRGVLRWRRA